MYFFHLGRIKFQLQFPINIQQQTNHEGTIMNRIHLLEESESGILPFKPKFHAVTEIQGGANPIFQGLANI
jgi:hypothetical protein